jgi:hypothetical protein
MEPMHSSGETKFAAQVMRSPAVPAWMAPGKKNSDREDGNPA